MIGIVGPMLLLSMALLIVDRHILSWLGGVLAGFGIGIWMWIRESPPEYVENWHLGAEGERKTERALKPLAKTGWSFAHDIQGDRGNIDHVAVGPAGVFLLETKNHRGIVENRNGRLFLRRRHDPMARGARMELSNQAIGAAVRLKEQVEQRSGLSTWVQPVVVFWSEFPAQVLDDSRCVYVHGSKLASWLAERPKRLRVEQVERVVSVLEDLSK